MLESSVEGSQFRVSSFKLRVVGVYRQGFELRLGCTVGEGRVQCSVFSAECAAFPVSS